MTLPTHEALIDGDRHTYLRKEGVHVTGLELELCIDLRIGGVAPLLDSLKVL